MAIDEFQAYRLHAAADGERPDGRMEAITIDDLSPGDTLVKVAYAGLNYKDALAMAGLGRIVRGYPRIGGIDLSGTIVQSADPALPPGREVVVHGFGIGVDHDGGYAQYARVPRDWVMPLPADIGLREAAALGAAGYAAALSLHWMEHCGLAPERGEVLVTGATGGVAGMAIDMLGRRGYTVCAMTGKRGANDYLRGLGAQAVEALPDLSAARPLLSARWAGVIDSVGGGLLAHALAAVKPEGVVAALGNAGGGELPTTVMPFILRGVKLLGINANSPMPLRREVWRKLARDYRPRHMERMTRVIDLEQLPRTLQSMLDRDHIGRTVVRLA